MSKTILVLADGLNFDAAAENLGYAEHLIESGKGAKYKVRGELPSLSRPMYETLLTNEECAKAIDLGGFYRVPADNRGLNYDKYFKDGDAKRNTLTEFNSNNTRMLNLEETKATIAKLAYIQERLAED